MNGKEKTDIVNDTVKNVVNNALNDIEMSIKFLFVFVYHVTKGGKISEYIHINNFKYIGTLMILLSLILYVTKNLF